MNVTSLIDNSIPAECILDVLGVEALKIPPLPTQVLLHSQHCLSILHTGFLSSPHQVSEDWSSWVSSACLPCRGWALLVLKFMSVCAQAYMKPNMANLEVTLDARNMESSRSVAIALRTSSVIRANVFISVKGSDEHFVPISARRADPKVGKYRTSCLDKACRAVVQRYSHGKY